jgi:hypothetical protein
MGTSNEAGKGGKCVSGNFEEAGSERLEIRQACAFHSTTLCSVSTKQSWHRPESELSSQELSAERFPASVSSTITQRMLVLNHREQK